jgi:hypothetical protein
MPKSLASCAHIGAPIPDEITPGTTVIVTDTPVVRKPVVDSTYFATN